MEKVPDRHQSRDDLAQDRGQGRPHHPPLQTEYQNGIKDDIEDCACQSGDHGKAGAPVRTDDRVHGLAEYIEGNPQRDPEKVDPGLLHRLFIYCAPEHGQDRISQRQVKKGDDQAHGQAQYDGIADGAGRILLLPPAQQNTDIGTGPVSDHDREGQGDDCQRKDDRICRIAIGSQIRGVGDEDLVDNIVESRDQEGNNAGNSIFPHQSSDRLRLQKVVCFGVHCDVLLITVPGAGGLLCMRACKKSPVTGTSDILWL